MLGDILAAFSMYTRLPAWRLLELTKENYSRAIHWWPLVGVLTGGLMVSVVYFGTMIFPVPVAVILGVTSRLMLTGAFHEDGLGDMLDGFGGGQTRERVLEIMKDSRVGNYAVIGYVLYFLLLVSILSYIPLAYLPAVVVCGDVLGRMLSMVQVFSLSYARSEEISKTGVVYSQEGRAVYLGQVILLFTVYPMMLDKTALIAPLLLGILTLCLQLYVRRRIGGYTGDTLGAVYLVLELAYYLAMYISVRE